MSMEDAIATLPTWISVWLNWMLIGAFILPLALFIWKPSRMAGVFVLVTGILSAVGVSYLYGKLGYVKLLGLPHILLWTPLVIYLFGQIRRDDMPVWPRRIMIVVLATILISLAFDYTDVIRYILGEREPLAGTLAVSE